MSPTQTIEDDGTEGPLEKYHHNQSHMPTTYKMTFIMTDALGVVNDFNLQTLHPYPVFTNGKGVKGYTKSKITLQRLWLLPRSNVLTPTTSLM
jgi:hypothetical protein